MVVFGHFDFRSSPSSISFPLMTLEPVKVLPSLGYFDTLSGSRLAGGPGYRAVPHTLPSPVYLS